MSESGKFQLAAHKVRVRLAGLSLVAKLRQFLLSKGKTDARVFGHSAEHISSVALTQEVFRDNNAEPLLIRRGRVHSEFGIVAAIKMTVTKKVLQCKQNRRIVALFTSLGVIHAINPPEILSKSK